MSDHADGYQGYSNRATWAFNLNLNNDEFTYRLAQLAASYAATGNGPDDDDDAPCAHCGAEPVGRDLTARTEDFHAELAVKIELLGRQLAADGALPDFDPSQHTSPNPADRHGPDDINAVNWQEIAETYELSDYR